MIEVLLDIRITGKSIDDSAERVNVSFSADELKDLGEFCTEVEKLETYPTVQTGMQVTHKISGNVHEGILFIAEPPDSVQIDATLHRVRPFLLNDERNSFNRIRKIAGRGLKDSNNARKVLTRLKRQFLCQNDNERLVLKDKDGNVINGQEYFDDWLNAREYHRDSDKRLKLEASYGGLSEPLMDSFFYSVLFDKIKAIIGLKRLLKEILNAIHQSH